MKLKVLLTKVMGKSYQATGSYYGGNRDNAVSRLRELVVLVTEGLQQLENEPCEESESSGT